MLGVQLVFPGPSPAWLNVLSRVWTQSVQNVRACSLKNAAWMNDFNPTCRDAHRPCAKLATTSRDTTYAKPREVPYTDKTRLDAAQNAQTHRLTTALIQNVHRCIWTNSDQAHHVRSPTTPRSTPLHRRPPHDDEPTADAQRWAPGSDPGSCPGNELPIVDP